MRLLMTRRPVTARRAAMVALAFSGLACASAALPDKVDFNYHVKPLLSDRCFTCHGPDERARKAKLRLDTPEGAFKALDGGMFNIIKTLLYFTFILSYNCLLFVSN